MVWDRWVSLLCWERIVLLAGHMTGNLHVMGTKEFTKICLLARPFRRNFIWNLQFPPGMHLESNQLNKFNGYRFLGVVSVNGAHGHDGSIIAHKLVLHNVSHSSRHHDSQHRVTFLICSKSNSQYAALVAVGEVVPHIRPARYTAGLQHDRLSNSEDDSVTIADIIGEEPSIRRTDWSCQQ